MFGAAVDAAVVVVVAEVPRCAGCDVPAAAPAVDEAGVDVGGPPCAEGLVLGAIPALCSGWHQYQQRTMAREMTRVAAIAHIHASASPVTAGPFRSDPGAGR
jgi:hypothetical protein